MIDAHRCRNLNEELRALQASIQYSKTFFKSLQFTQPFPRASYFNLHLSHLSIDVCESRHTIDDCILETCLRRSQGWRNKNAEPSERIWERLGAILCFFGFA